MGTRQIAGLGSFDPDMKLAGGDYLFHVKKAEFGTFPKSGRDCLILDGEFVEGPYQPTGIEVAGRKQTIKLGFPVPGDKPATKNMMGGKIRRVLEAVGDLENVETGNVITENLEDRVICVTMREQKDSDFLDAAKFRPASEFVGSDGSGDGATGAGSSLY